MFVTSKKLEEKEQEMEQELSSKQSIVDKYSKRVSEMEGKMRSIFQETEKRYNNMEDNQKELDEQLKKVKESVKTVVSETKKQKESNRELRSQAGKLMREAEKTESTCRRSITKIRGQGQNIAEMIGQTGNVISPSEIMHPMAEDMRHEIEEMKKRMTGLKALGKQMEILSLNAAIEAGRMGEDSRKFVEAVENVRGLAEKYGQNSTYVSARIEGLENRLVSAEEQIEHLTRLLLEQNMRLERTAEDLGSYVTGLEEADIKSLMTQIRALTEEMGESVQDKGLVEGLDTATEEIKQMETGLKHQQDEIVFLQKKSAETGEWMKKNGIIS